MSDSKCSSARIGGAATDREQAMGRKAFTLIELLVVIAIVALLAVPFQADAIVQWRIQNKLNTGEQPLGVETNGRLIFVLTDAGNIQVYSREGKLEGSIKVGSHIDQIKIEPADNQLLAISRQNKTIEIIELNFINISGSPAKGFKDAPVILTVFSDFQ